MSVTRPAPSRASVAPGTSRSTRAATSRKRPVTRQGLDPARRPPGDRPGRCRRRAGARAPRKRLGGAHRGAGRSFGRAAKIARRRVRRQPPPRRRIAGLSFIGDHQ
jgi:hypothetical protein